MRPGRLGAIAAAVVAAAAAGIAGVSGAAAPASGPSAASSSPTLLLVAGATGRHAYVVDDAKGVVARIDVGAAPHGIALAPGGRAFVAAARGVAIVDTRARRRVAFIPYRAAVGPAGTGEYRPGGMGIAASPDGRFAYVGVHLASGPGRLEVVDVVRRAVVASVPVGVRPFEVLITPDGRIAAAIDHDSYSVTVVDTRTFRSRTLPASPLGPGVFDKPHYGAVAAGGRLVLPFQGRVLLLLDPVTGRSSRLPLTAETHQHGVALTATGRAVIVGTGPAGSVEGPASLTVVDIETGEERVTPLRRAHERVAVRADGRRAYLSGGYLLEAGAWDGVSVVDLATGRVVREIRVPSRPLGIAVLP